MKCDRCGNTKRIVRPKRKRSPSGLMYVVAEGYSVCDYCVWKGDEGPGKQLRDMVKEEKGATR